MYVKPSSNLPSALRKARYDAAQAVANAKKKQAVIASLTGNPTKNPS